MPPRNDYITKSYFDEVIKKLDKKFDLVMQKLDWLVGKYKAHDEEHTLLNGQVSDHSDRIEVIEGKLSITP